MKKVAYIILVLVLLSFEGIPTSMYANEPSNEYSSDILLEIATQLGLRQSLDSLKDAEYHNGFFYKDLPLTVIIEDSTIGHIGYSIFTKQQRHAINSPIVNFLERYSLELDIPTRKEVTAKRRMQEDGVVFEEGDLNILKTFKDNPNLGITIQTLNDRKYTVTWMDSVKSLCSVSFPIDFELLNGTSLIENTRRLKERLLKDSVFERDTVYVDRDRLKKMWNMNYYVQQGDAYYFDNLNSNRYYELDSLEKIKPIFCKQFSFESVANLFTATDIPNDFVLQIRIQKYGLKKEQITVPLHQWINFCQKTGCKPYIGFIKNTGENLDCELIMRNVSMGYSHVMKFTFDTSMIEARRGFIPARLNCYIPTSRISKMFKELDK